MWQIGNSQLEPSQRHELQYQASYGDLFLQASYTYVKDYITSIIEPYSDDPHTNLITWTNTASQQTQMNSSSTSAQRHHLTR